MLSPYLLEEFVKIAVEYPSFKESLSNDEELSENDNINDIEDNYRNPPPPQSISSPNTTKKLPKWLKFGNK
jgi:hypothetical protein